MGLLYGAVFFQLDTGDDCDENCYTDRLSLIFFSLMLMIMGHLPTISELIGDRLVFIRERGAKRMDRSCTSSLCGFRACRWRL